MADCCYAECHFLPSVIQAKCRKVDLYAEYCYAECRGAIFCLKRAGKEVPEHRLQKFSTYYNLGFP
jgi:hypothetical protein